MLEEGGYDLAEWEDKGEEYEEGEGDKKLSRMKIETASKLHF